MPAVLVLPLLLQLALPLALLAWLALAPNRSVAEWLTKAVAVAGFLVAIQRVGLWLVLPWYTPQILLVALTVIAVWQLRTVRRLPWRAERPRWTALVGRVSLAVLALVGLAIAFAARYPPSEVIVDLEFPLRDGTYYVAAGGSSHFMNPHLMTLTDSRFESVRGQSCGVDIVKLGRFGLRASGLLPADPARYAIFGEPVFAPCRGVVVHAEDGMPDLPPPQTDRTRLPGNHVLLDCGGIHVLLAHLRQGSLRVGQGMRVTTDTVVGLVGNSGNTTEPHLHVHAQRPAAA